MSTITSPPDKTSKVSRFFAATISGFCAFFGTVILTSKWVALELLASYDRGSIVSYLHFTISWGRFSILVLLISKVVSSD